MTQVRIVSRAPGGRLRPHRRARGRRLLEHGTTTPSADRRRHRERQPAADPGPRAERVSRAVVGPRIRGGERNPRTHGRRDRPRPLPAHHERRREHVRRRQLRQGQGDRTPRTTSRCAPTRLPARTSSRSRSRSRPTWRRRRRPRPRRRRISRRRARSWTSSRCRASQTIRTRRSCRARPAAMASRSPPARCCSSRAPLRRVQRHLRRWCAATVRAGVQGPGQRGAREAPLTAILECAVQPRR